MAAGGGGRARALASRLLHARWLVNTAGNLQAYTTSRRHCDAAGLYALSSCVHTVEHPVDVVATYRRTLSVRRDATPPHIPQHCATPYRPQSSSYSASLVDPGGIRHSTRWPPWRPRQAAKARRSPAARRLLHRAVATRHPYRMRARRSSRRQGQRLPTSISRSP